MKDVAAILRFETKGSALSAVQWCYDQEGRTFFVQFKEKFFSCPLIGCYCKNLLYGMTYSTWIGRALLGTV